MARVILNKPEIRRTSQDLAFPLVDKTMDETLALARRYVPVRKPRPYDKRPTGRLKKSLRKVGPKKMITQVKGSVGSRLKYAISVHDGANPHTIVARKPNLVFYWEREDVTFVGKKVNHPGVRRSSRTQYLYLPLAMVGRRNGFIVRRIRADIASPLP
jgi:hypothetical protein